jgi:hypothetical protein
MGITVTTAAGTPANSLPPTSKVSLRSWLSTARNLLDWLVSKVTPKIYSATLTASGWSGSGPYTQTVSGLTGITVETNPDTDIAFSGAAATDTARLDNWQYVDRIVTGTGTITATCYREKPAVDLPIRSRE